MEELATSKHLLEGEVARSKTAMESEHWATVEALTGRCQEYEGKLGKSRSPGRVV